MSYAFPPDIAQLVQEQLATGCFTSEDDLLRAALQAFTEQTDDERAIREAIAEKENGDPRVPLNESVDRILKKFGYSPDA